MMFKPLLPKKLTKEDSSFSTVEELKEVLHAAIEDGEIKNVALTGPFGSGKSSILQTLRNNYTDFEYLPISLATLQAHEKIDKKEENDIKDEQIEFLNQKIEYSILQQLIYREKVSTVPNSRFRRIIHIDKTDLRKLSIYGVLFIIAFLVAFEPSWLIVDSIYNTLNFGKWNLIFDSIAVGYMLYVIFRALGYIIKSYSNSKLNKLNLKDGVIELKEENSIFNKHLDEILYFFQVTKYNVVIIEDLDRFGTSDIFLKLRELNLLINESKIVGRNVVFLYAVKDDVFINEDRTKFFDYITTVIPVINPSNSKDKLREALIDRGLHEGDIKDEELTDIAFFIQDMRILTNIANEFTQYRQKLLANGQKLNLTKLLAMIVYKNYHPQDFAQLHRRAGKVYECINSKSFFVNNAMESIVQKETDLENEYKLYLDNRHLTESELRYLYMDEVRLTINDRITKIQVNDQYYLLKDIANNEHLFNEFIMCNQISYYYYYSYTNQTTEQSRIDHSKIESSLDFNNRLTAIKSSEANYNIKRKMLQREKLKIRSFTLSTLITKYEQGESNIYKKIELSEMMDVFIRRGFIDEEYYDYISYFYDGMVSLTDRDLLLSIKRDIPKEYTYHIDKVENFVKELLPYMFESDAILNNDLVDFLAKHTKHTKYNDLFDQFMYRLEKDDAPLGFLAQYYKLGKCVDKVFEHYITWNEKKSWENANAWENKEESNLLIEAWLKYSSKIEFKPLQWLNSNYSFLAEHYNGIGFERCKEISDNCCFESLNSTNQELINYVIQNSSYSLNSSNICLIINTLLKSKEVTESNLNLSRVINTGNDNLINYIKDNISTALTLFSSTCKDESPTSILYILNETNLSEEEKRNYLQNQKNLLDDISGIGNEELISLAYDLFLIKPTWTNVATYYSQENSNKQILYAFIEKFSSELGAISTEDIPKDIVNPIFIELFSSDVLSISTFETVVGSFHRIFSGCEALASLDSNRLTVLLKKGKLRFSEENTAVLKKTEIYVDYLLFYNVEFYAAKDTSYFTSTEVAESILSSDSFTPSQKNELIAIIPDHILRDSQRLADLTISILINYDIQIISEETLRCLLSNATIDDNRVKCIALMIQKYSYEESKIIGLLTALGGKYKEIAEREKHPVLDDAECNKVLVSSLQQREFISSYKVEKDGIRIWPKRLK